MALEQLMLFMPSLKAAGGSTFPSWWWGPRVEACHPLFYAAQLLGQGGEPASARAREQLVGLVHGLAAGHVLVPIELLRAHELKVHGAQELPAKVFEPHLPAGGIRMQS